MIRRLMEGDRGAAIGLLKKSPTHNMYLLGNTEQLGFGTDYCEFWGDFGDSNRLSLRGILNRYMTGWSVYGAPSTDWAGMAGVLDGHSLEATRLQDNPGGVASFTPFLETYRAENANEEEIMHLTPGDFRAVAAPVSFDIRRASLEDLDQLSDFYADAGSMRRSRGAVERPLRDLRVWVAVRGGLIRSAALTNAELSTSAMIGGVYTEPDSRNLGLGQAVCSALCSEILHEGKQPVLYWQEPAAGVVYRNLGFRAVGVWRSVWLKRRPATDE